MEETTTTTAPENSWFQDAMKKGLILGVIHIVLFVAIYYTMPSKVTGFSYLFAVLAINFTFIIIQGRQWRAQVGGFISFGAAFKYAFVIFLFNGLLNTVFIVVFLFAEPALPDNMAQSQLDTSLYWAKTFGAPDNAIEKMQEDFNPEEITKRYKPLGLLTGVGFLSIFYALGALIIALFVKKNQPEVF
jgi:hypothetical protein